jgi:hypothetical protein
MSCTINSTKQEFSSIYLSAQAPARKAQIHAIIKSKIFENHAISGVDFNCVENTDLDIRYQATGNTPTYANAGGKTFARAIADCGLVD